jgi:hypothetical protein
MSASNVDLHRRVMEAYSARGDLSSAEVSARV